MSTCARSTPSGRFNVKLLRDRARPEPGYGFLEFESHKDAEEVLNLYRKTNTRDALQNAKWGGGHGNAPATRSGARIPRWV